MKAIELTVNGRRRRLTVEDDMLLLDMLRDEFGVTSVREGCGVGACGACTVLVERRSVSSCLARAVRYDGATLTTADGLAPDDEVIDAFVAAGAMQCGYCVPGFVMMAHELLGENPDPTPTQIAEHIAGNICRCGTYPEICEAIGAAAARRKSRTPHDRMDLAGKAERPPLR